jgi:hypothetical protein
VSALGSPIIERVSGLPDPAAEVASQGNLPPVAILYRATLTPTKIELLKAWVPQEPWLGDADASTIEAVGAYRFDDPDGEVGLEAHLLQTSDGQILHVPVTYRASPLAGAESFFIATTQHSVLGERWVYDACGDPVYVKALATAVLSGGTQAELEIVSDAGREQRPATTLVSGSGSSGSTIPPLGSLSHSREGTTTVIRSSSLELTLVRVVDRQRGEPDGTERLVGTWPGHDAPALLAYVRIL